MVQLFMEDLRANEYDFEVDVIFLVYCLVFGILWGADDDSSQHIV
jgi:hypothetical protein